MKTIAIRSIFFLSLSLGAMLAHSANVLTGQKVRVTTPIEGNVYAGAGEISIEAVVNGDVTAGTGELRVMDTIRHDLMAAGGRVFIDGVIGEDLRCGGGEVTVRGNVLGDVVVGCGELEIGPNAVIYGDLVVGGGRVRVQGVIMGSVVLAGGEIDFSGEAAKDTEIRGGEVTLDGTFRGPCKIAAETLTLGSNAAFYQNVRYWDKHGKLDFNGRLRENASATFDESLQQDMGNYNKNWFAGGLSVFFLYWLLAGALLITFLVLQFDSFFRRAGKDLPAQWMNRFGMGMLYLLGVPAGIVLLFITVIGIPFGLFAFFGYLFTVLFCLSLTAVVGAYALEQYRRFTWTKGQRILVAIGLLILLKIVVMIPAIGFLLALVAAGIGLGSIIKAFSRPRQEAT